MELSSSEDIDAPIDAVFTQLNTTEALEAVAIRRGAKVRHRASSPRQGVGAAWDAAFVMQGKEREVAVEITEVEAPSLMCLTLTSRSLEGDMTLALTALSENRTRLTVSLALRPLTLTARLLVKSMGLAQAGVAGKFQAQVARMVAEFTNPQQPRP